MVINVEEVEKAGIIHAIRVAIVRVNTVVKQAFDSVHPYTRDLDWYGIVKHDIEVLKGLKIILDKLEGKRKENDK